MKRTKTLIAVAAVALCGSAVVAAVAAKHTIVQKGKAFSASEITIAPGESISFMNEDAVVHNVFSTTPGMEFDLRTQQPGAESTVPFTKEGTCEVRCAIHPKMKITVKVQK